MMIYHIYQYELDFACTSASGNLYTLAKEKLNMSKFTKAIIASALAVAVSGPAAADLPFYDVYISDKPLKVNISGGNCKNTKVDFATSTLELFNEIDEIDELTEVHGAGFWELFGFPWAEVDTDIGGLFTTWMFDKDLTAGLFEGFV